MNDEKPKMTLTDIVLFSQSMILKSFSKLLDVIQ